MELNVFVLTPVIIASLGNTIMELSASIIKIPAPKEQDGTKLHVFRLEIAPMDFILMEQIASHSLKDVSLQQHGMLGNA